MGLLRAWRPPLQLTRYKIETSLPVHESVRKKSTICNAALVMHDHGRNVNVTLTLLVHLNIWNKRTAPLPSNEMDHVTRNDSRDTPTIVIVQKSAHCPTQSEFSSHEGAVE
jgi:hypothetical protein